ncbi:LysM peptidoglycan-binding domain-containing protein [Saccharibacillus kuerlensis]|uniref:LysM domain-containing protein n=1 Tax=Saccharibacillus kuerlensis TaxID=459527 RepID=A0ABQ2L970_9BACL|nr:LysM peptidoglycan-binding domain-containing protein [Saccharibacillus kuerlensis]GGO07334.1 hypothetical protein GCM10010969_35710 [Saccharibacillus kuerlensis]
MPKYTTYKSIYETAGNYNESHENKGTRGDKLFSSSSFLHSIGMPKYRFSKAGAARFRLLLFIMIGLFAGTGVVHALQNNDPVTEVRSVIVSPGDTLWSIAESNKPKGTDTRIFISGIKQKNGLSGSHINTGDELLLPNF